ncbi:hypothetical protein B1748_19965 [Paenibacillus sp. MY03]|uniref:hypothetical protein n=1 Tax=Paenibacillus sp. MY03 TaxID=302980 RepID=UPI000B3D2D81|nr:hypothetical protein [Paenibacillus sp. MY03]OUS74860.1 hypothetical protein B1748_19965 [Paenibacillus sp. MY03]
MNAVGRMCLLCLLVLIAGCGTDATDNSQAGAKAKVTQLVKDSIGNQLGATVAKTVKVDISKVTVDESESRMYLEGNAQYKREGWSENGVEKESMTTFKFQYNLQHNGTEWTVKNKLHYDEEASYKDKK